MTVTVMAKVGQLGVHDVNMCVCVIVSQVVQQDTFSEANTGTILL